MVFVLTEKRAENIFAKYPNVAAFTLGNAKKPKDAELELSFERTGILPDDDTINAVLAGDMSKKKVIKKAVSAITEPSRDDERALYMLQIVSLIKDNADVPEGMKKKDANKYLRKHAPNVIVFVLDGEDKKKDKFLTEYVTALFAAYGVPVMTKDDGKVLKIFDQKKTKKVVEKVKNFEGANNLGLGKKGRQLYQLMVNYYAIEITQQSLSTVDDEKFGRKRAAIMIERLTNVYTGKNLLKLDDMKGVDKKDFKAVKEKDEYAVELYGELADMFESLNPDFKLPKVKYGITKKGKKKGNFDPKMDVKKFAKYFFKPVKSADGKKNGDRRAMVRVIYAHTAIRLLGVDLGAAEYNKYMRTAMMGIFSDEFIKKFVEAAKAAAKAQQA